jgi:hypothetical protein
MLELYERAVRLDPSSVPALTGLVLTLLNAQNLRPGGMKDLLERTGELFGVGGRQPSRDRHRRNRLVRPVD